MSFDVVVTLDQLKVLDKMPEHANIEEMRKLAAEVVISGLSGRLPESDNIAEFREHLINGDDMVTEDDRRWEPGELYSILLNALN